MPNANLCPRKADTASYDLEEEINLCRSFNSNAIHNFSQLSQAEFAPAEATPRRLRRSFHCYRVFCGLNNVLRFKAEVFEELFRLAG